MAKKLSQARKEREELYKELTREAKRANALLQRIQGHYGNKKSWAGKVLTDKLSSPKIDGLTAKGFVKHNKNMSTAQMRAVLKATKEFTQSKTSTVKGIEETKKKTISSFGQAFDVTDEEAETLYRFVSDAKYISAEVESIMSEIMVAGEDTKDSNGDFEFFKKELRKTVDEQSFNDEKFMADLTNIWEKYFK